MPNDILGRKPSPYVGAFAAEESKLRIDGIDGAGLLVQSLQVGYQQPVQPLFEVGSNNRYFIVGRAQGSMGIERVFGPQRLAEAILARLGNVCSGGSRVLNLEMGSSACTTGANAPIAGLAGGAALAAVATPVKLIADGCVASGVNYRTESQQMLLQESTQVVFGQLSRA
jgi:hypothetical protein